MDILIRITGGSRIPHRRRHQQPLSGKSCGQPYFFPFSENPYEMKESVVCKRVLAEQGGARDVRPMQFSVKIL